VKPGAIPALVVVIPVEGRAAAYASWATAEEGAALKADLGGRDVAQEVAQLLDQVVPLIRSRPPELDG
jgi:hypothetical protein